MLIFHVQISSELSQDWAHRLDRQECFSLFSGFAPRVRANGPTVSQENPMVQFRGTSLSVDFKLWRAIRAREINEKKWCQMGQEHTRVSNQSGQFLDDRPDLSQAGQMSEMSKGGIWVSVSPFEFREDMFENQQLVAKRAKHIVNVTLSTPVCTMKSHVFFGQMGKRMFFLNFFCTKTADSISAQMREREIGHTEFARNFRLAFPREGS